MTRHCLVESTRHTIQAQFSQRCLGWCIDSIAMNLMEELSVLGNSRGNVCIHAVYSISSSLYYFT